MTTSTEAVRRVLAWADRFELPVVIGNGLLCRESAALADRNKNLYLFGGMGLASAVASGLCMVADADPRRPPVVLEGDGNFAMGLQGAAQFANLGSPVTHVVLCNGTFESSGGQTIPAAFSSPGRVADVARALGYDLVTEPADAHTLGVGLARTSAVSRSRFFAVRCEAREDRPPRPAISPREAARRFAKAIENSADR